MKLFAKHKVIHTDLGEFKLADALEKLTQEGVIQNDASFSLIKKVNDHHLIFKVPRDKATPSKTHEFKYNIEEKRIEVSSQYNNIFFPNCLLYIFPLLSMYLVGMEAVVRDWQTYLWIIGGITAYTLLIALTYLKNEAEAIERMLAIRLNYLARKAK